MTRHPRARLLVCVLLATALLAACSGSSTGLTSPNDRSTGTTPTSGNSGDSGGVIDSGDTDSGAASAELHWASCGGSIECASLDVPLNWSAPEGKKLSLHLARKPASGDHKGSILFNFGGPGVSGGSDFGSYVNASFDGAADTLNEHYDLVSWDPRGTGKSDGVVCTTKAEALADELDPTPDTPAEVAALTAKTRSDTTSCVAKEQAVLPYIDTWSTVRDLDAIRAALGDRKLTYVGFSYGTELGMSYLATFPTHVRAMVLDGIALPQDPVTESHDQAVGFERAVRAYLADCKAKGSSCSFGDGNPLAAFTALTKRLEGGARIPASGHCSLLGGALPERKGTLGVGEFDIAVAQAMYDKGLWPLLTAGLAQTARHDDPDGACLLALRDAYVGIRDDGKLDHLLDSFHAIGCADQSERAKNPLGDRADLVAAWGKELPLVGAQFAEGLPGCWGYPAARHPLKAFTAASFHDAPPVVIVGNTGDPATPFAHAQQASQLLPGSVLVTYKSTEHTAFLGHDSSCVDDPLVTYLLKGTLPQQGLVCTP